MRISDWSSDVCSSDLMARRQQLFFKFNGLAWWTDTLRATATRAMSHRLALNRGYAWDNLDPDLARTLSLYGIDAGKWDIIRQGQTKLADGRDYVIPNAVQDASDETLGAYLAISDERRVGQEWVSTCSSRWSP